jgi:hypothetical protein
MVTLMEYHLSSRAICLGERKKKGTYRSSILTIPYSQIVGALEAVWGSPGQIHAVGYFTVPDINDPASLANHTETHIYSRRDLITGTAVLPIETRILTDVLGRVFVVKNDTTASWQSDAFQISMGAYRLKGLGDCLLKFTKEIDVKQVQPGRLRTRIPEDLLPVFGIDGVQMPIYGYLFRPDNSYESGTYVRSLFEGSLVSGPVPLLA